MDKAVLDAALRGDEKAFDYIYNHTVDKAHRVAYGVIHDQDYAMDIVQESFIKMWQNLDTLQDPARFESWFFQIVRHKALDFLEKNKNRPDGLVFSDVETGAEDEDFSLEDTIVDDYREFSPEASLDYSETQRILWGIVNELPEKQRDCVLLRFRDNMKISEIADTTGLSESTVKSCLRYAQDKIAEALKKLEREGTKLYGITPLLFLPFLRWMFGGKSVAIQTAVASGLPATATAASTASAAAVTATTATAGAAAAGTATAAGTTAASVAGTAATVAAKAGIGVAAKTAIVGLCAAATVTAGATLVPVHEGNTIMDYITGEAQEREWRKYVSVAASDSYDGILMDFSYEIPQIDLDTPEAQTVNQQIQDDFLLMIAGMEAVNSLSQELSFLGDLIPSEILSAVQGLLPDKPLYYHYITYSGTVQKDTLILTVTSKSSEETKDFVYQVTLPD